MFHTSVPIKVGRIYRLALVEYGTHSFSTSTSFRMHCNSSFWSKHCKGKAKEEIQKAKYILNTLWSLQMHMLRGTLHQHKLVAVHRGS